jgi:cyclomaltodextrinase
MKVKKGIYKHFKRGKYKVLGVGKHSETLEDYVIYEALYKNELSKLWVRPINLFTDYKEIDGKKVKRFEYIGKK